MTLSELPDSPVAADVLLSSNHGERRNGRRPDMLLLHYTGMPQAQEALDWLRNPASGVSCHYLVFEDGRVAQLVPEERRAWHAGAGSWGGEEDVNSCSIGIEIANPGHDGGLPPYPAAQIESVIALGRDIAGRWSIPPERVLGHSDTAPGRKQDPGERFPWADLHRAGLGHWVDPAPIHGGQSLARGSFGAEVEAAQAALSRYGYGVSMSGIFDEATEAVVAAFQRHFRPGRVDGMLDESTLATLDALTAARPSPRLA